MAGYGLNPGESFPEKLEIALRGKGHDVVIVNAGVSGDTSSGGLSRLDWSVPDGTQLVILELGANDMLRGVAPDITEKNLDAMIARLKERKIAVLLAGMRAAPNLGPTTRLPSTRSFRGLPKNMACRSIRSFSMASPPTATYLLDDGMHPNAAGIDRMVERVLPEVERMHRRKPGPVMSASPIRSREAEPSRIT